MYKENIVASFASSLVSGKHNEVEKILKEEYGIVPMKPSIDLDETIFYPRPNLEEREFVPPITRRERRKREREQLKNKRNGRNRKHRISEKETSDS